MKIRLPRTTIDESIETITVFHDYAELLDLLTSEYGDLSKKHINIDYYCFDDRLNWDTYIITANGEVIAYTDGPIN